MYKIIFIILTLMSSTSYAQMELPNGFCSATIETTEGKIEIEQVVLDDTQVSQENVCKDYIMGRLNRLCLSSIFENDAEIEVVVHRKNAVFYIQSFMSAQCNLSMLGNWSFEPDISSGGYYYNRNYDRKKFLPGVIYSDMD